MSSRDDPLRATARERPEATALEGPRGEWCYGDLDAAADALALRLAGAGLAPGDRVACLLESGVAAVVALHGVPRSGASVAPLHSGWTEPELDDFLRRLRPRVLLCDARTAGRASGLMGSSGLLVRLGPAWAGGDFPGASGTDVAPGAATAGDGPAVPLAELPTPEGAGSPPGPDPEAEHTVLATSGTSGRPRGVRLSLANHLACQRAAAGRMGLGRDDRWLASLSPAHVGGVALVLRAALTGARLVLRGGFDAGELLALAGEGRITHASLVPTMLRRVLRAWVGRPPPESLRGLLIGGDAADPRTLRAALDRGWPLYPTYGLTEAASQVATATPDEAREHPDSVGRPLEGVEVDVDGDEIVVRGPTVGLGYLGTARAPGAVVRDGRVIPRQGGSDPEEAADPRDPGAEPLADEDGWLHTGDSGRRDLEGRLYVTGRLSERLVTGGVTVDPSEVERVLGGHPAVAEVCVAGVEDPEWGDRLVAVVVRDPGTPGADPDAPLGEAALAAWFGERLAAPKRPRAVRFVDRIPKNANGKPDREAVRALFR